MTPEDVEFLYDQLVALCLYNERGYLMMEHTPAEIACVRDGFRRAFNLFLERIGQNNVPVEILNELHSNFVLEDGEGVVLNRLNSFFPLSLTDPLGIDPA